MLPDIGPEIGVYNRHPGEHSGVSAHLRAKLLLSVQIRIARWIWRRQAAKRLRLVIADLASDENRTWSGIPNLIESLETRLALTNDVAAREQALKYLSEP